MSKTDQVITLKDGRKLGFAEYGDPKGKPVFYFHGWPSSRLQANILDKPAKKLGVRVISLDRPGYGLSDFVPGRKLLDWPDTVIEVADKLHIKKFAVEGVSGGGPYAAVCAYKIPERLTKVGIVVGLAPTDVDGVLQGMASFNKFAWHWYHRLPFLMEISSSILLLQARKLLPEKATLAFRAKADQALMSPSITRDMEKTRSEAFRHGKRGAVMDLKIYTDNWGFKLKDIKVKVYLWYGSADKNVSLNMGKYYASQISGSNLTIYPGEGHFVQVSHGEQILKTLVQ